MKKYVTVRELIEQLEAIENKDLDVVIDCYELNDVCTNVEAIETTRKYYKAVDNCGAYTSRDCVVIVGWE